MLTLFSIPKAFSGHIGVIQDNAIGSWVRLGRDCEVILFGDDPGVAEAALRHGTRHVPSVARTRQGTPILSDIFAQAETLARHPLLCYVNADIVLFDDLLAAVERVVERRSGRKFLLVSSRFDLQIEERIAFAPGWDARLRARARNEGQMYPAAGSDFFVFTPGLFNPIPPFAVGRGFWDNWLMRRARSRQASLIDATAMVTAVHQYHDYTHVPGVVSPGKSRTEVYATEAEVYATEEGQANLMLAGGVGQLHTMYDASEILTPDGRLLSTLRPGLIRRRIKAWLRRAMMTLAPGVPANIRRLLAKLGPKVQA